MGGARARRRHEGASSASYDDDHHIVMCLSAGACYSPDAVRRLICATAFCEEGIPAE
jgi:hypothetical protein